MFEVIKLALVANKPDLVFHQFKHFIECTVGSIQEVDYVE